jgi:hypothetical protein
MPVIRQRYRVEDHVAVRHRSPRELTMYLLKGSAKRDAAGQPTINPSVFVVFAGLWLLGASIFADYRHSPGFDGRSNDRVVGGSY